MPIKTQNRHRYPRNWKQVRAAVLERAGNRCEFCGVENYAMGYRDQRGEFVKLQPTPHGFKYAPPDAIKIILTVAHLDHQPENCDMANLRALCQRCHLQYDTKHHQRNAAATRRAKRGNLELFNERGQ